MLGPIATSVEVQTNVNTRYLRCIKEGVIASLRGAAPIVAIEFARKAIFSASGRPATRPTPACKEVKAAGG